MASPTLHEGASTTRQRILEVAEELFLKRGYDGVSVRDLTEAAGVNVAAINYHFRGKKNLFREAVRRLLTPIAERRLAELSRVVESGETPDLRAVIRAFVEGFMGDILSSKNAHDCLNLLFGQMSQSGIATDLMVKEMIMPVNRLLKEAIMRARPEMTEERVLLSIASVAGQVIHFVRARELIKRLTGRGYNRRFVEEIIEHITDFSVRGIG